MYCVRSMGMFALAAGLLICHASAQGEPRSGHEPTASTDTKSESAKVQLPAQVDLLYNWAGSESVPASKLVTGTENKYTLRARRNSLEWIRKVVDSGWLPEDPKTLDDGLVMVRDESGLIDATHAQWEKSDYLIRVGQTKTVIAIELIPLYEGGAETERTVDARKQVAKDMCRQVLTEEVKIEVVEPESSRVVTRNITTELLRASFDNASITEVTGGVHGKCAAPDPEQRSDRKDHGFWWRRVDWYADDESILIYTLKTEGGAWEAGYGSRLDDSWF